ncbi:MAG TPA: TonB family protein [Longimicrobium sp.]|nr:TonB family protein [Longimicrobium sp.]
MNSPVLARLGRAILPLAAALLLPVAHVQAQSRAEQLLSDRPPARQGCVVANTPGRLPTLPQLADSAALATAVADFARRHPLADGRTMFALYSIAFNAEGGVERVKELDYLLPQGQSDAFEGLVRAALVRQAPGKSWSLRLRIEPGAATVFRVGRSERCEPESGTRFRLTVPSLQSGASLTSLRLRVVVEPNGQVSNVQLLRRSGNDEVDRWVEETLRGRRFQPGLVDGVAVQMETDETVQINTR